MAKNRDKSIDKVRQCASTRIQRPVDELIRFVLDPEGRIVPDLKQRLPGRGVWLTAAQDVVAMAVKKTIFSKAFRQPVQYDPALAEHIEGLFRQNALQMLAFANKAGKVIHGFSKVEKALEHEDQDIVALIQASDAAEGGCQKLIRKFKARFNLQNDGYHIVNNFNGQELSLALGRPNVIHAVVKHSGTGTKFLRVVQCLKRYQAGSQAYAAA